MLVSCVNGDLASAEPGPMLGPATARPQVEHACDEKARDDQHDANGVILGQQDDASNVESEKHDHCDEHRRNKTGWAARGPA